MDRHFPGLAVTALILGMAVPALAQSPSPISSGSFSAIPSPAPKVEENARRPRMSPEELRRNIQRWKAMTKEERQAIRFQAKVRADRMEKSVEELEKKNGWTLSPEGHQQLLERFAEERKNIEDILRKEMEEKRRPMIKAMMEKLKVEFSSASFKPTPSASPTAEPAATPTASPAP